MTINKKVKKCLKISGLTILGLLLLMIIIPMFFQKQLADIAVNEANKSLNARISIENFRLTLLRNFPNPTIVLKGVVVANVKPFSGDTLLKAGEISASIDLFSIFSDVYHIKKVSIKEARVQLFTNVDTLSNWDIVKPSEKPKTPEKPSEPTTFNLKLDKLVIKNTDILYHDAAGKLLAEVTQFNFELSGNLSNDFTTLAADISAKSINLKMNNIQYLNKLQFGFTSKIEADLKNSKYTALNTEIRLNALLLQLEGWVALPQNAVDMDVTLKMPQNKFKNILSLIPAIYAKNFKDIQADGQVAFSAFAKGRMQGKKYPAFGATLTIDNAKFQYPALPAGVTQINLNAEVANKGGSLDNTVVDIRKFSFVILENPFGLKAHLSTPISDPNIDASLKGTINLSDIKKVYPLESGQDIGGLFTMDIALKGLLSYVEKQQYDKFDAKGTLQIKQLILKDPKSKNDVHIPEAELRFSASELNLTTFSATIGRNSIAAKGYVQNYLPYIFKDGTLKGSLNVNSNYLNINDFMSPASETPAAQASAETPDKTPMELVVVPANLDLVANLNVKKLIYDNINLDQAQLACALKDSKLSITNLAAQLFSGGIKISGSYATPKPDRGYADLNINVSNISTKELCQTFRLFDNYLPILNKATGRVGLTLNGSMALDKNMELKYDQLNLKGILALTDIKIEQIDALNKIAGELKMDQLKKIQVNDLKIQYAVVNGKMQTAPFDFKINVGKVNVESGSIGLDKSLDYTAVVAFPMQVLGQQTVALANTLATKAASAGINTNLGDEIKFAVKVGGTLTHPTISVGLDKARNLIENVVEQVKEKVQEVVTETVNRALEEAQKQAAAIVAAAQKAANDLIFTQKQECDRIIANAKTEADKMIASTNNPLEKAAKKAAADLLIKEAQKKVDKLTAETQNKANKMVTDAQSQGNALIEKAKQ